MKLPGFKRLNKQDYAQEFKDLVDRLSVSLNIGLEVLYTLGNNNISLTDNIFCTIKDITIIVDSAGIPLNPTSIGLTNNVQIAKGTHIMFAENQTNSTIYPTGAPFITFIQNGTSIIIKHITGLPANNQFLLRVVVWG